MRPVASAALAIALLACSDSGDGLARTFGDCGAAVCVVSLDAFTSHPGSVPYCEGSLAAALACSSSDGVEAGSCDGLRVLRRTYGFPGDSYTCIYDESSGDLVGASWSPDAHPRQDAGVAVPAACSLGAQTCSDGGLTS